MYDARQEPNEFVADSLEEARSKAAEFFGTEASALQIVIPAVGEMIKQGFFRKIAVQRRCLGQ